MATRDEQLEKLAKNRKAPRPSYYDAASRTRQPISFDFETYLILLDNVVKSGLITRLRQALKATRKDADLEAVKTAAYEADLANEGARLTELDTRLGDLAGFQSQLVATNPGQTTEMLSILQDINAGMGDVVFRRDQAFNRIVHVGTLAGRQGTELAGDQRQQMESWVRILQSYLT